MDASEPRFTAIYAEYASHVWRVARYFGVPQASMPDLTQEVWLSAFHQMADLDVSRSLRPWLTAVVWNHVRHLRRSHARHARKDQALVDVEAIRGPAEVPQTRHDAAQTVERLLHGLPEEQREVLVLCDGEGLTASEVSEALGVQLNTVYSRLRLARNRCKMLASSLGVSVWALSFGEYRAAMSPSPGDLATVAATLPGQAVALGGAGTGTTAMSLTAATKPAFAQPAFYLLAVTTAAVIATVTIFASLAPGAAESTQEPRALTSRADDEAMDRPSLPLHLAPAETPTGASSVALTSPLTPPPSPHGTRRRIAAMVKASRSPARTLPRPIGSLAAENTLIKRAQAARDDGRLSEALMLLNEHLQDYPEGASADTRDLMRIGIHCRRRDPKYAQSIAAQHPGNPQFAKFLVAPCGTSTLGNP